MFMCIILKLNFNLVNIQNHESIIVFHVARLDKMYVDSSLTQIEWCYLSFLRFLFGLKYWQLSCQHGSQLYGNPDLNLISQFIFLKLKLYSNCLHLVSNGNFKILVILRTISII